MVCPAQVDDDDRAREESSEIAALRTLAETWKSEADRLRAQNAELLMQQHQEQNDPNLRPLGLLIEAREYEAARRAIKNKTLRAVVLGQGKGRLFSTEQWIETWRRITGRRR